MMKPFRRFVLVALLPAFLPLAACSGDHAEITAPPAPRLDASDTDPAGDDAPPPDGDESGRTKNTIGNIR